ncbi:type II 3-dehydroquinate dehydratase [Legionella sp. W05-934-2]|jgi:3-dehydroquinate dehydratase-2|uniref:type II 3-dehydroquinate dehydratase n=1 Tax=Legionella sp. W05-934-2 TaxID=1198649 RepID=UPI0034625574
MTSIYVIHGPNLNKLGEREPNVYGHESLKAINDQLVSIGEKNGVKVNTFQSNHEGEVIDFIHQLTPKKCDIILINPAAFTHTSIAIRDALLAISIPFIEVHLSNVYQREPFRHKSYFSDIAVGIIAGFGSESYFLALQAAINHLKN